MQTNAKRSPISLGLSFIFSVLSITIFIKGLVEDSWLKGFGLVLVMTAVVMVVAFLNPPRSIPTLGRD